MTLKDELEKNFEKAEAKPAYVNAPGSPQFKKAVQKYFNEAKEKIKLASSRKERKETITVEWQSNPEDTKQLANEVCALLHGEGVTATLGCFSESRWHYNQQILISF